MRVRLNLNTEDPFAIAKEATQGRTPYLTLDLDHGNAYLFGRSKSRPTISQREREGIEVAIELPVCHPEALKHWVDGFLSDTLARLQRKTIPKRDFKRIVQEAAYQDLASRTGRVAVWDAEAWLKQDTVQRTLHGQPAFHLLFTESTITAMTTDDELADIARQIIEAAKTEWVLLEHLDRYLLALRRHLAGKG